MPDETFLICALVDGEPPIQGSIMAVCVRCSRDVWVAPTGQGILGADQALTICVPCGLSAIETDREAKRVHMTQAQMDEITSELRRRRQE